MNEFSLHKICNSEQYRTEQKIYNQALIAELAREFPSVANTIAFKNRIYHWIFNDKLIVIYNQLPGISNLIQLATLNSNQVSYMQIDLTYG